MTTPGTPKKKLLMVLHNLGGGGAERVALHLMSNLDRDAYEIHLVLFEETLDYAESTVKADRTTCLNKRSRWDFVKMISRLRRVILDYKPDVVFSLLTYENIVSVIASSLVQRNFKLVVSEHLYTNKYLPEVRLGSIKRFFIKMTYKRADTIVTVSKAIGQLLVEEFDVPETKVTTIYNPIPLEQIREKSGEDVEHLFFGENNRVLIGVGRLEAQKRYDVMLRAFAGARGRRDDLYLVILGKGPLLDDLRSLSSSLGISAYVDFAGFQSNPFAWISKADIFVLSSDYEGFPMVLIECMACGTPIVSTDCPSGPAELITHGETGILVPPGDSDALARGILSLLDQQELRDKFATAGLARVEEFRVENIIGQYERIL